MTITPINRRAHQANVTKAVTTYVSLEARDEKGRLMGANITRVECDFIDAPEDATWWQDTARRGHAFGFCPHATRNKVNYGAGQRCQWFDTAEQREAAISKYLASAQKRANKRKPPQGLPVLEKMLNKIFTP